MADILLNCILSFAEFEIHRLFKSNKYNFIEHRVGTICNESLSDNEWQVLFGDCLKIDRWKMITSSPLINEVFCDSQIDYRLLSLGVVKHPRYKLIIVQLIRMKI